MSAMKKVRPVNSLLFISDPDGDGRLIQVVSLLSMVIWKRLIVPLSCQQ